MRSILGRFFGQSVTELEEDAIGCDMAPAPSVLATAIDPAAEQGRSPVSYGSMNGPFTTSAQAPIRDS